MIAEIDNSKRSTYAACPRKYLYRCIKNLVPEFGSSALRWGSTWHACLEGYYSSVIKNGYDADNITPAYNLAKQVWEEESKGMEFYEDYRTLDAVFQSFIEYLEHYNHDKQFKNILASERMFRLKLTLTSEEKDIFPFLKHIQLYFTGKLDLEVELSGQKWIEEFKSTGQPIQLQAQRLNRTPQIIGYNYAAKELGIDIVGVLTSIHQILSRKKKDGTYGKFTRKFQREPNIFSDGDFIEWRNSFLYTCNQIMESIENEFFPQQFDNCFQYGKCSYACLCEQNRPFEELNTDGFIEKEWNVLETGGSVNEVQILEKQNE